MDIKKNIDSDSVVDSVEKALQSNYESHSSFNSVLDELQSNIEIVSLKDSAHKYGYTPSEVLYWVDRKAYGDELDSWQGVCQLEKHQEAMAFLKRTKQESIFNDLVDAIRVGRIVPFFGAGLSKSYGYPMWGEALKKLAEKIDCTIDDHLEIFDYLGAAQALYDHSSDEFHNFIRTEFRQRSIGSRELGVVSLLPQLVRGCVITTNFDSIIEDVLKEKGHSLDAYIHGAQEGHNFFQKLIRNERCILKLHGDAGHDKTYIFTMQKYDEVYGNPICFKKQLPRALRQIFISHSLLFVGCSLEQDRTLELFQSVVVEESFEIPDHFALLNAPTDSLQKRDKERRLLKMKIRPIWYDAPNHDHALLEKILALLLAVANREVSF